MFTACSKDTMLLKKGKIILVFNQYLISLSPSWLVFCEDINMVLLNIEEPMMVLKETDWTRF